ncbi:GNAT family N-acetyltransferase [Brachybacterium halotolerans subsp. kimchii]|uniref:GNAT family N-acetyltransferase n=1 Tax=Brachybacterium halotolerans TaxID=2795215 RepID=UPI001E3672FD|nr:GNAT family N-acetyltransferase [Brachybacterium halotolerans]UEJ82720.1 GNAT family N-acetyltransferase [Brachybacterium halotolerans subsp. kimchii]
MTSHLPPRTLPDGLVASTEAPAVEEYVHLRTASGLSPRTPEQAAPILTGSWAWQTVRDADGALVAMGRVIGDGGWYFHIADMATAPAQQGRGIGRVVLDCLIERIRAAAPPDPYITLIADPPGRRLYDATGFVDVAPSLGMRLAGR